MQLNFNSTSSPTPSSTPTRTDGRTNEEVLAAVDQVSVADAGRERRNDSQPSSAPALARAALARTRANLCIHGVKLDHCADCTRAATETEEDA